MGAGLNALADEVRRVGRDAGLDAVGIAAAGVFEDTRRTLQERKRAGLHGGMQFTYRNPERSTDPSMALAGAAALVVGARSYRAEAPPRPAVAAGAVARYSWRDHYAELRVALEAVSTCLMDAGFETRALADDNALVDREAAYRAGLGWYGKSSNLLLPGRGSWFVLGSVVTTAPLPVDTPIADGCGPCTRCISACPTDAIVASGVVDARRCLAWLVQTPGVFPHEYREALGDRIYGCDDCQEVCPPNRQAAREPAPTDTRDEAWVPLVELLASSDDDLLARFGRWYIAGREPRFLRRNALVALGNVGDGNDPGVELALRSALASPDPIVRAHAVWATSRLDRPDLLESMPKSEEDAAVLEELAATPVPLAR